MTGELTESATGVTVRDLVDLLSDAFRARGIAEPVHEAREIVAALYDAPRFWPVANAAFVVDDATIARARIALDRRLRGAPLAYAVGRAAFRNLTLDVD